MSTTHLALRSCDRQTRIDHHLLCMVISLAYPPAVFLKVGLVPAFLKQLVAAREDGLVAAVGHGEADWCELRLLVAMETRSTPTPSTLILFFLS